MKDWSFIDLGEEDNFYLLVDVFLLRLNTEKGQQDLPSFRTILFLLDFYQTREILPRNFWREMPTLMTS